MIMVRLSFVLLVVITGAVANAAEALKEIRVGSSNISVTNVVAFYARDRKFFEAEGFDVKMIIIRTEAALAALSAGELDYATLSTSAVEGALKGMPIRLIAVTNKYPLQGLVVRKGIGTIADLRGKKLSVSSFGGATYAVGALSSQVSRPAAERTSRLSPAGPIRRELRP